MKISVSRAIASVALSAALAFSGAVAIVGVGALAPDQTGVVEQAQAKVKVKKKTFWRGDKAEWTFIGVKKSKIKFKSSNKKVVKITKKGKITAVKAGKATLTAKYKGKVIGRYKVTVKEATKFVRTWKLKSATIKIDGEAVRFSESDVASGILSGTLTLKKGGKGTIELTGKDPEGNSVSSPTTSFTWVPYSATYAQIGSDGTGYISGNELRVSYDDGSYMYFVK